MTARIRIDRPILVVDDTNATRYSTSRFLRAAGVEVMEATTGQQALELAPLCGAIVLDVHLPDFDGFEVCRRLRAGGVNARVPVIHLSAQRLRDEDRIRGLDSGADAYLTHPADSGVLVATVNALLRARAAEAAEQESRERFEAVFRTAPVGIALVSPDFELLDSNTEMRRILGIQDGTGELHGPLQVIVRDVIDQCGSKSDEDFQTATVVTATQASDDIYLDCRVTDLGDSAKLLLAVDVTSKRVLEVERETLLQRERDLRQQAEGASRAKDSFLALLSHELRNPLAPISSAAQMLQMAPGDTEMVDRVATIITRQVGHMRELVDDLMDVSRVTRGLVNLEIAPLELRPALETAVEQVRPLIESRGHAFEMVAPDAPVVVDGDRTRLIQVTANLLNNAAKYTPPNGHIRLELLARDGQAVISVVDTGIGMSNDLLPHVFDLFTQAERTPDRSQGGLGVGLALVKSIVQLHEGRVAATSDGEGRGSTFTVSLPLSRALHAAAIEPDTTVRPGRELDVLLVDDNVDATSTLADVLRMAGHRVRVAYDATTAVEQAARADAAFDVFVLDIGLPGMNGHELLGLLKQNPKWERSVFFALTGYGQASDRELSRVAGFDCHLVKPVEPSELVNAINACASVHKVRPG